MILINLNRDLMVLKVPITGLFILLNLPNHLNKTISFKLMAIKIVVKVEHFTAIVLQ